jgi:hypothetical protein
MLGVISAWAFKGLPRRWACHARLRLVILFSPSEAKGFLMSDAQ